MKITKEQLKQLIKESLKEAKLLKESKKFAEMNHLVRYVREQAGPALHLSSFDLDNEGQVIIYTNLWQHPDGTIHDKPYARPEKQSPLGKRLTPVSPTKKK